MRMQVPSRMHELAEAAAMLLSVTGEHPAEQILAHWIAENGWMWPPPRNNPGNIRCGILTASLREEYPWFTLAQSADNAGFCIYSDDIRGVLAYCCLVHSLYAEVWLHGSAQANLQALAESPWDEGHYGSGKILFELFAELTSQTSSQAIEIRTPPVSVPLSLPSRLEQLAAQGNALARTVLEAQAGYTLFELAHNPIGMLGPALIPAQEAARKLWQEGVRE
jgi:hypothetical protein